MIIDMHLIVIKLEKKLKWKPEKKFEIGLEETFNWYLENYKFFNFFF